MRFVAPLLALLAAVATAQQNAINVPPGGLQVTANTPVTITWTDPSSGTITIKLQQGAGVTPNSGVTLESDISASALTATFTIPADEVNASQYNFEIIDNTNPNNVNFSPGFAVQGATGTGVTTTGTASGTASATLVSTSSLPSLGTSSATLTSSSFPSATPSSAASTATSATSQPTSQPTDVTSNNGAGSLKIQGGLLAAVVGLVAVF